jgi:hypothetical protein
VVGKKIASKSVKSFSHFSNIFKKIASKIRGFDGSVVNEMAQTGEAIASSAAKLAKRSPVVPGAVERLAKFTDPNERSIAEYLESFGRKVERNPLEGIPGAGRQPDAIVDGVTHEFKTLTPGEHIHSKTISNVVSDSLRRGGQARNLVFDARNTGLSKTEAQRGIFRALGAHSERVDYISIIGDDFLIGFGPR